ncbi:MAG: amino acid carrier protein [Oscillospiraceae bacterium]|jgi:AGCS family alanine or glycine:cation symporter|nr:amino acid carrier protein [Oscillospiraceae bacterium]
MDRESVGRWAGQALEAAFQFLWGPVMLALLLGAGVWLTARTGCLPLTRWRAMWRRTFGDLLAGRSSSAGGLTPFQAMSTALASTAGTGNVTGVAAALMAGGPGAVFWMWVSAFFGMATKYAEVVLAQRYRRRDGQGGYRGGPMYVLRDGLGLPRLAALFALAALPASVGMGNMVQSAALAQAAHGLWAVPVGRSGLAAALITALVVAGGARAVARTAQTLVPCVAGLYLLGALAVLALCCDRILPSLARIAQDAFALRPAAAGAGGYALSQALRVGLARGAFSNEAGLGSASIAHAAAGAREPVEQGFWGAMEVFLDTLVLCTLTALVILASGAFDAWRAGAAGGAETLAISAFTRALGPAGAWLAGVCTILFALGSLLGWCFYGEQCCAYLFPGAARRARRLFRAGYIAAVYGGAVLRPALLWSLADLCNALMAVPNLTALFLLSGTVARMTRDYWSRHPARHPAPHPDSAAGGPSCARRRRGRGPQSHNRPARGAAGRRRSL